MSVSVSVVVPTYNRGSLIGQTLESILDQSCIPAEVIVVDDGSTDDTESVIRRFPSMVKYHRIENAGVSNARNVGVAVAVSPWIAFCDSDDLWTRDKLAKQLALHGAGGVEYSFTNFRVLSGGQWKRKTEFDNAPPGFFDDFQPTRDGWVVQRPFYDDIVRYTPVLPSTVLLSKRHFERVGGFRGELGKNSAEDLEFTLRCMQHFPIGAIAEPLVGIRKHESNFSGDTYLNTCGKIFIFQYALQHHALSQRSRNVIAEQINVERADAAVGAFERADFSGCAQLLSHVPRAQLNRKTRLKFMIASLPKPFASFLRILTLSLGAALRSLRTKPSKKVLGHERRV